MEFDQAVENSKPKTASRSFLKSSLIYALGDLLTKGARIILIPYFIACLTKDEVGLLAIMQALIFASWTLMSFGFGHAIQRFYNEYTEDQERFTTSVWLWRMVVAAPFYLALMWAGGLFASTYASEIPVELVYLAITAGFFRAGLNLTELWLIIREQALAYRTFTFCQFLMTTLLTIYLISGRGMGVKGAILAELISYSFWTVVAAIVHLRAGRPKMGLVRWRESLSYCLPVLPHAMFMWAMAGVDRILLERHVDKADIGEYHIGYLLASVVSIGAMAMRSAWLPAFYKQENRELGRKQFGKMATLFFYFVAFAVVGVFVFASEIVAAFSMFGCADYGQASHIMRIVVIGIAGYCVFLGFNQPLFYERRIALIAAISGLGLLINVGLNLWLIPPHGIFGAAIATVGAYLTIGAVVVTLISRLYHIEFELSKLLIFGISAALFGATALVIPAGLGFWAVVFKSLLILGFLLITLFKMKRDPASKWKIASRFDWLRSNSAAAKGAAPSK